MLHKSTGRCTDPLNKALSFVTLTHFTKTVSSITWKPNHHQLSVKWWFWQHPKWDFVCRNCYFQSPPEHQKTLKFSVSVARKFSCHGKHQTFDCAMGAWPFYRDPSHHDSRCCRKWESCQYVGHGSQHQQTGAWSSVCILCSSLDKRRRRPVDVGSDTAAHKYEAQRS